MTIYLNSCSSKGWRTSLRSTLDVLRCSRLCSWFSSHYGWCVSRIRCDRCSLTVLICNSCSGLNRYTFSSSDKVFFRSEGYSPCSRINGVASFSCYDYSCRISRLTSRWIHQFLTSDLSCLIIAQIESWCLCLRNILNVRRNFICRGHCNWCDSWSVLRGRCLNVLITNRAIFISSNRRRQGHRYAIRSSCKSRFWNEGHLTSRIIDRIGSFACYGHRKSICWLTSCWVYQFSWIERTWSDSNPITI